MKKTLFLLFCMMTLAVTQASALTLSYQPTDIVLTIEAGRSDQFPLAVTLQEPVYNTYMVFMADKIEGGNLPLSWLQVSPPSVFIDRRRPIANATVSIYVPKGTAPGAYSGFLKSRLGGGHGSVDSGRGVFMTINVPSPCGQAPSIQITSIEPNTLWPPDHSMRDVTLTGKITSPAACTSLAAKYEIIDEYGTYSGTKAFTPESSGEFSVALRLEASRDGNDKDGRLYTVKVTADNEAGTGTSPAFFVVVPHDQRKK